MEKINIEFTNELLMSFINGLIYCRKMPRTEVYHYPSYTHVDFGEDVGGRTDEFFIMNNNLYDIDFNDQKYQHLDHFVTIFSDNFSILGYFEERGYTFSHWEHLMYLDLEPIEFNPSAKYHVRKVKNHKQAVHINQRLSRWAINESQIDDDNLYHYYIRMLGRPVAHGRFSLINETACLDNIYTSPKHRGKGAATALCTEMLLEAKQRGARMVLLASSQMGYPLYLKLGFKKVAPVMIFSKKKGLIKKRQGSLSLFTISVLTLVI
ncbi:GNAT family N-acetyltransferase [Scopulibacillus cellulosilyticus]|uniref:GNAT family N-acetyltransferase n=1 Tax=Scopulibacillus cellulosilyticus TaxID=2665665 RepID=A0ABW2PSP4_9BACL